MKKPIILCVDDEKIVLDSLKNELGINFGEQFVIEIAESGQEALDILQELIGNGHDLPLVISDYIMPELKGDEVLRLVKEKNPDTYCIMLTGQATIEGVTNAINCAGLYRYISKPWETNDLLLTINEAVKSFYQEKEIQTKNKEILQKNKEITEINLHLEDLVKIRTAELEQKRQEIDDSINYSRRIQMAIMGDVHTIEKQFPFSSILYLPKDVVSGDFYWYAQKDDKIILVAADCTGHGVPGAFMSIVGMSALNEVVNEKGILQPDQILNALRKRIVNILSQTGKDGESKDGMDISIIVLDLSKMMLEYSGAFNSLYFVRNDFSDFNNNNSEYIFHNNNLLEIKADRVPIGISDMMDKNYSLHSLEIKPNDVFYILTDGYFDQIGGAQNKKLLSKRFKEKITEIKEHDIIIQKQLLTDYIHSWKGSNEQVDDILVIGIKVPQESSHSSSLNDDIYKNKNTFFEYSGEIDRNIISDILDSVELKLVDSGIKKLSIKKMNIVLIELLQNVLYYFEKQSNKLANKEFCLEIVKEKDGFHIECSNSIFQDDFISVKNKIEKLNIMDDSELQHAYKQQLNEGDLPRNHGAGLGFMVITQRSKRPIKCELETRENNSNRMKLILDVVIK
jgi:phosphoserine phosphatase RsbU/P